MEPIFNDKVRNFCYKLAQGLTKILVHVGRIQFGGIGTFQDRKLCIKTCFNLVILINFADFSGVLFFCPKCANTSPKLYNTKLLRQRLWCTVCSGHKSVSCFNIANIVYLTDFI